MWDAETNGQGRPDFLRPSRPRTSSTASPADKKFRFKPDWEALGARPRKMPVLPDHFDVIDNAADEEHRSAWSRRRRAPS